MNDVHASGRSLAKLDQQIDRGLFGSSRPAVQPRGLASRVRARIGFVFDVTVEHMAERAKISGVGGDEPQ